MIQTHENLEEMSENWQMLNSILLSCFEEKYRTSEVTGKIIVSFEGYSLSMMKVWDGITQMEWNIDPGPCAGQNIYYCIQTDMVNIEHHFNDRSPKQKKQNTQHFFDLFIFSKVSVKSKSFFSLQFQVQLYKNKNKTL